MYIKAFLGLSLSPIICILIFIQQLIGQEIPEVINDELPGFFLNRNDCYDGASLWGYMNGGADIYLEYGFEKLRVEEFVAEDKTIKLEVFKMADPVSAFGIYSIKTFKCKQHHVVSNVDCLNSYQFQLLYGCYYIQLINESGSEEAKKTMVSAAEKLLAKIDPEPLLLPVQYLTDSLGFSLSDIKMLKGPLGIHNKAMYFEDSFIGIDVYQVYYAKTTINGEKVKYYEIVFNDRECKSQFLENTKKNKFQIPFENDTQIVIEY